MHELTAAEFYIVNPMLEKVGNKAVYALSVIQQLQTGKVLVNDRNNATAALITSVGGFYCLLGAANDAPFNEGVIEFLNNKNSHPIDFYALALFSTDWEQLLAENNLINAAKIKRAYFHFNKEKFLQAYRDYPFVLNPEFNEEGLNPEIADQYREDFYSYYKLVWDSAQQFIDNGVGHFVTKDDKIISVCSSPYVGGGYAEIDIITVEKYKRKGLATLVGVRFINECLNRGLTPNWCCHSDNIESLSVAHKLCFEQVDEHPMYWYNA
ncbi:GNAT family N-acetyltransferase [Paenibacillus sp. FSL H8-0537]|uniref:GNAT family N-acetyltransferase n=1 Tax=Paenibacillus sp. FSL H8-0537 TaxID=2921399 RepID=UPI0031019249